MRAFFHNLGLCLVLSGVAFAAACGGGTPPPEVAPSASSEPNAPPPPSAGSSATPNVTAPPGPSSTASGGTPIGPSKLAEEVKKAGIDIAKSPSLEKMASGDKKKLMPFFVKALGMKDCSGCHASLSDYKTVTRNMQLTRGMWTHFVAQARDASGGTMFCDSCHVGSAKILNRSDKDAVKKFMQAEYVGKLKRADKKDMECMSCHGDAMDLDIFGKLWNVKGT
jgi:hypothetical protein